MEVEATSGSSIGIALLIFAIPCVFLVLGYLLGKALGLGEMPSVGMAGLGLVVGFLPAVLVNRAVTRRQEPEFTILAPVLRSRTCSAYVRPVRDELKCRDFDLYRAGLLRAVPVHEGAVRLDVHLVLNYDFTFLALLLTPEEEPYAPCRKRCSVNPCLKRPCAPPAPPWSGRRTRAWCSPGGSSRTRSGMRGSGRGCPPGDWRCCCTGPTKRRPAAVPILTGRCGPAWRN